MGEIIALIGKVRFQDSYLDVELNKSSSGSKLLEIHVQSESFRMEICESDFVLLISSILVAEKKLSSKKRS